MENKDLIQILKSYKDNTEVEITIDSKPYDILIYHDSETKGKKVISLQPKKTQD